MTSHVLVENADGILIISLNRPDKKNALTDTMYGQIADALEASQDDDGVRAILIRGEGEMFTAGNDIAEFAAIAAGGPVQTNLVRFLESLAGAKKAIVAAVQGSAIGVGATMLLHCDYVVLARDAILVTPFVNLALVPEAASSLLMPARIGYLRAFSMFALGEPIAAQQAVELGLANRAVDPDRLDETALDVACRLARQPIGAVIATKALLRPTQAIQDRLQAEIQCFADRLMSPEAREAFEAFAQKRVPDFTRFS